MNPYRFQTAGQIVAGRGALERLPQCLTHFPGAKRAFIVAQDSARRLGFLDAIAGHLAACGMESEAAADIGSEPTERQIEELFSRFKEREYDLIIGIGGGSALDAAKLVSVMSTNPQPLAEMVGTDKVSRPGVPTLLVPTTAGTGSEVTPNAIVTFPERQLKIGVVSRHLMPAMVIIDAELTVSLPPAVTAATGMDAFTHSIESFISNRANPISDMFALESIRLISSNLLAAYRDGSDKDAREAMLLGSMYGGMALTAAGTAAVHALAYPIGGQFHVPHGVANSMLLPHVMRFNMDSIYGRLAQVADAMGVGGADGSDEAKAERVVATLEMWTERLNIDQDLGAYGVVMEDVPGLAAAASKVTRLMDNNPKPMTISDIESVYARLVRANN